VAKTNYKSVDQYIASQPKAVQALLDRVRNTMHRAVPGGQEAISYQIPVYKLDGRPVFYFAGWKAHYSLYPSTRGLVEEFKDELAPYEVNDKGTMRFPLDKPVPVGLIGRMAKFRVRELAERHKAKSGSRKKR
jgi:uncharacterized protein YdhG (YjbR/CyaY superfamily)